MSLRLQGVDVVIANLQALAKRVPDQLASALYEEASAISTESMKRTPVDTGALRASHLVRSKADSDEMSATITVGGAAADYAIYVHERLDLNHEVGQAKFLESALTDAQPELLSRLASRIGRLS